MNKKDRMWNEQVRMSNEHAALSSKNTSQAGVLNCKPTILANIK